MFSTLRPVTAGLAVISVLIVAPTARFSGKERL
jgi:hypothetical protein